MKDDLKKENYFAQFKVKCTCGHTVEIKTGDRKICTHCNNYVYKNKQTKFKYDLIKALGYGRKGVEMIGGNL